MCACSSKHMRYSLVLICRNMFKLAQGEYIAA